MVTNFSLALVFALLSPHLAVQEHDDELFEKSIRPILVERCVACHNPAVLEGGLDLTSAAGFVKGATTGPLLPIEATERSRLLAAISYEERVKMPPDGRLDPEALDALRAWVEMGAPWPEAGPVAASAPSDAKPTFTEEQRSYWAFQPISDPAPPSFAGSSASAIDGFIGAKLEAEGLESAPPAARAKGLVQRVVADDHVEEESYETARRITDGAPLVARWHKKFIDRLSDPALLSKDELDEGFLCFGTRDFEIGMTAFLEKKKPEFTGR